jgi:hypothetical protein
VRAPWPGRWVCQAWTVSESQVLRPVLWSDRNQPLPRRDEKNARTSQRHVIMTICQEHGTAGFINLLMTRENGVIVLNPHLASCFVLRLDEKAATSLHDILGEWLGWAGACSP